MADEQDTSLEGSTSIPVNSVVTPGAQVPANPPSPAVSSAPPSIPNAPITPTQAPASVPAGPAVPPPPPPKNASFVRQVLARVNVYLLVFVLLLIVAAGVIALSLKTASGNKTKTNSLTSADISNIKGATTVVGSNKQTLDVQSDSIFEGQVLTRNNLDVAGNIKVGGALSLPVLNVSGQTNVSGLHVGQDLNVAGATDVQGQLTLHKGLTVQGSTSFGNLSAASLSVTSLQLNGDLGLNRHIVTNGNGPSKTAGSALGSGGTASVNGNDIAGTVNVNIGSGPGAGQFITVTFAHAYGSTPHVIVTPVGSSAGGLQWYVTRSNTGFSIGTNNAASAGTSFAFDYFVVE